MSGSGTVRSGGTAWLTVRRRAPDDVKERELYVLLDGKRVAVVLYGDEPTLTIPAGRHELLVHNTLSKKRFELDAAPGQHLRFSAANMPGRAYAYWAFFLGAALMWTRLERDEDGEPPEGPVHDTFRLWP